MVTPVQSKCVLVVDDNNVILLSFQHILRKYGWEVETASSAEEAEEVLEREGFDAFAAVVADYYMPGGTGLDLLSHVRTRDPTLTVVIVTSTGEKELVTNSLRGGAFGYLEKPVDRDNLIETVSRAIDETGRRRQLRSHASSTRAIGESQLTLLGLHTAAIEDRISMFFQPRHQASGDFVSFLPGPNGQLIILASDVSGHGVNAAYQSIYFQGIARGMVERGASVAEVFEFINNFLMRDWNQGDNIEVSIAAFGAVVDLGRGVLEIMNCGFPTPVLFDHITGRTIPLGCADAGPLGWFDELPSPVSSHSVHGVLTFWSDGLESLSHDLGVDALALAYRFLMDRDGVDGLVAEANDDVIVVRSNLDSGEENALVRRTPVIDQRFSGDMFDRIDWIQGFCERSLEVALPELEEEILCSVVVCMREAVLNALDHGCQRKKDAFARLCLSVGEGGRKIYLEVEDSGDGYNFDIFSHEIAAGEQMLTEHRGLVLMKNLSKEITFLNDGRFVSMAFEEMEMR